MNAKELSIMNLVDSIENTDSEIEQQIKILEEIRVYIYSRKQCSRS